MLLLVELLNSYELNCEFLFLKYSYIEISDDTLKGLCYLNFQIKKICYVSKF